MPNLALPQNDAKLATLLEHIPGISFRKEEIANECDCTACVQVIFGSMARHDTPIYEKLLVLRDCDLSGNQELRRVPRLLVSASHLNLSDCSQLKLLPESLYVGGHASFDSTPIESLPPRTVVEGILSVEHCEDLSEIHGGVSFNSLHASGAKSLRRIEGPRDCRDVDLQGTQITEIPAGFKVSGEFNLSRCRHLTSIAEGTIVGYQLNLEGCHALFKLPKSVQPRYLRTDAFYVTPERLFTPYISPEDVEMMIGRPARDVIRHHLLENLQIMDSTIVSIQGPCLTTSPDLQMAVTLDTPITRTVQHSQRVTLFKRKR